MNSFEISLNQSIVKLYRSVEKLEEAMLRASHSIPLTISEIHLLEAVRLAGGGQEATISELSDYLGVRLPSVTPVVNKLVAKGYVSKERCDADGRVVHVRLTRLGRRAERAHNYFHRSMARTVTQELTEEEKSALLKGLGKLEQFLDHNIQKYEV